MPVGREREKILYRLLSRVKGIHRYTLWRWGVGIACTIGIALLPATNTLRFDLWRGNHYWLGERVDIVGASKAFVFPFLAVNILIIIGTRLAGRYLCGFVCPVGSLARLSEWSRYKKGRGGRRFVGPPAIFILCVVMGAITFSFWVDWLVFLDGSTLAKSLSAAFLGSMILGLYGLTHYVGLSFCRDWCPSGVYFAVLGHRTVNGVEFHEDKCTECGVCDKVCPMDLHPREMSGGEYRGGSGFYGEGMSNFALCIRCGDCVIACEEIGTRGEIETALTMGNLPEDSREYRDGGMPATAGLDE